MLKINIEELQKTLQKPIKRNCKVLGLDIATRTGWALIQTTKDTLSLEYGFMNVESKDPYIRFDTYINLFRDLIQPDYQIVIEDCYFGGNVVTLKFLAKLEGIAYCAAKDKKVKVNPIWIAASSARKTVGAKGNAKKPEVAQWIKDNLDIELPDEDLADAVILAFVGVLVNAK